MTTLPGEPVSSGMRRLSDEEQEEFRKKHKAMMKLICDECKTASRKHEPHPGRRHRSGVCDCRCWQLGESEWWLK